MQSPLDRIKSCLIAAGYQPDLMTEGARLWSGDEVIPLLVHSRRPRDIRTSAIAVTFDGDLTAVRASSAPYAFKLKGILWEWWSTRGETDAELLKTGRADGMESFFRQHRHQLNPDAVYRAKTWGRMDPSVRQQDFIDAGLMPLVEREVGQRVRQLLEENVKSLASALDWTRLTDSRADERKAEWLIKAPFWLLAAKILRDKRVPGFIRLDLKDVDRVFSQLGKHYHSGQDGSRSHVEVPANRREALLAVAQDMDRFASLELMSTEALGYIYESTLINKATRKRLGTHSTPAWLIDYITARLRPWIMEMPAEGRHVFEPACGHCGFLVSALRLLDELRPSDFPEDRKTYLRRRLHGVDVDPFSQEVARLALTLADVPNPNGWDLMEADMFSSEILADGARRAQVVLANPPFEPFKDKHQKGWLFNKAAETFYRTVLHLQPGGVFGFVLPQSVLSSGEGSQMRRHLLRGFEIQEITLFADKVFEFGEPESVVILGRKLEGEATRQNRIIYQRVREGDVARFAYGQAPSSCEQTSQDHLAKLSGCSMLVPEAADMWEAIGSVATARIKMFASVQQGFSQKSLKDLPAGTVLESTEAFAGSQLGFALWAESQFTHHLPEAVFLNLAKQVILRPRGGTVKGIPQVLLNYPPVSRESWRLKALLDEEGHPVASNYLVVRPLTIAAPLAALWAILNSPVGNGFAFCHFDKRNHLAGRMREMPVPDLDAADLRPLISAAEAYLSAARTWSTAAQEPAEEEDLFTYAAKKPARPRSKPPTEDELRILHWRMDAEVMKLYGLPPEMERRLLDLFAGVERRGVPFKQTEYYPRHFHRLHTINELLAITADWERHAKRKSVLIQKKVQRRATSAELEQLKELKRLSGARIELLAPLPVEEWRTIHARLISGVEAAGK